jgi:hydrogenase nickel incorporation protein HypA/HybF
MKHTKNSHLIIRAFCVFRGKLSNKLKTNIMHEISLCESILELLQTQATLQNYSKVKVVYLEIGKLSSIEPEALRFGFDIVMKNSIADNARLDIIEIDASAWCFNCEQIIIIEQRYDPCPLCGAVKLDIKQGEQMRIKELEVI